MKMAKQLETVLFDDPMYIREEADNDSIMSEVHMSGAGTHIVYEAEIKTPYITLESGQSGWITEDQLNTLTTMWKQIGLTYTLVYDDNSTVTVRMAKEKRMVFTPLYEGACIYTAVIPLAKMI